MNTVIHKHKYHITQLSGVLIVIGYIAGLMKNADTHNLLFIFATIIAGIPIFIKAIQSLMMKVFSIELLVSIAVVGALFIREFSESAIVTFLFLLGDYLEARTLEKTRSSIKGLIDMTPKEATVIRNGKNRTIPVEEVIIGDLVFIRSGGKIPVDGRIITGKAVVNEAAITGESVPVSKDLNNQVFSGTIVDFGYIEVVAEKVGDDTTFAKIIELVEEAQESKTKVEKFLDKFSNIYTSVIVALSIIVYAFTRDLHLAITFLVIACPGALVIGAPVSNVAGIGNGAKNGVLVKGGEVMDKFAKVDVVVFDKTGTLTKGKPEVTDIKVFKNYKPNQLLKMIAKAEMISEHHLGQTIVNEAIARDLNLEGETNEAKIIKGKGIRATIEAHEVTIGNRKLMDDENIDITEDAVQYAINREKTGNTAVFAAVDGQVAGIISIADQIREDAQETLAEMRKNGIKRFVMLTGDNKYTAELIADKLGMDEYHAELLPENKVEYIMKLKEEGHVVAMAGDGINDAPAIAAADIGLAMGEGGTDIAIETADVVLMQDKLLQLSHAYSLSKKTMQNMKQNIYFAVSVVFLLLIGVLFGFVHLASGMFIHEASVLIVILNGMRLIYFNQKNRKIEASLKEAANII